MFFGMPALGHFNVGPFTAAGGTAFAGLIPPNMAAGLLGQGVKAKGRAKVGRTCYTTGATAHKIAFLRPLNYTTFSADAAAAQAVLNVTADPGLYATAANWKYDAFPNGTPAVANNAIAANDYVVYQNADGTYTLDTVSSVSSLAITMTSNVPTGGVKAGGLFYFYGIVSDLNPWTGLAHAQNTIAASQTRDVSWSDSSVPVVSALHDGDPLIFYSPNGTNAGTLEFVSGWYGKF